MDDISRQALATAVGVIVAVYIALWMGLEQPYWAALSVMIISNTDRDALFTKGVLRVVGTIVGVTTGYVAALWSEPLPPAQLVLVALAAGIGTYGRQRSAYGYAWFYGALTFMLMIACAMTTPDQIYSFAWYRCYEIVIGVTVATLANWAIGPGEPSLPHRLVAQSTATTAESALRQSAIGALGVATIVIVWSLFNLPQLVQVLISSLIIIDANPAASRHRGWQRILGCIIGGTTALAIIWIDAVHIWWWTISMGLGVFTFARMHLGKTPNAYIGTQSAIALLVTMVGTGPPDSILPPIDRLIGIVIGVSIMTVLIWALNPRPAEPAKASA
ncbi:FUSC family protein [Ancylobacter sp. A5.8]|uniref:FUSC family protein n=1 Tax=Ancylobacter gelatini TaxID=2919920 RepID=UPI001F4E766B|nr:FUSC family protein [Ancylobacter gelatini]MCJ8143601.1 FUSC family protein [Ancylobacter gelatini]